MESKPLLIEKHRHDRSVTVRVFGVIALVVTLVELLLCFAGPIAFVQKPSLVLFPPFSNGLTADEVSRMVSFIEREIALSNSFSIVSRSFIENYFVRTNPDFDKSQLKPVDYTEALRIARELRLERFALATIWKYYGQCELTVSIRETMDGEIIRSCRFDSDSFENLLKGIGTDGKKLEIQEGLRVETKGIGLTDFLVLGLLALQLAFGILAVLGRDPGVLTEIILAPALILFLFAFIYAQNANMDYVQRYIASHGQIHLAKSTALEQLYAFLRFGPILLLNAVFYAWRTRSLALRFTCKFILGFTKGFTRGFNHRLSRGCHTDSPSRRLNKNWLLRSMALWAMPWVVLSAVLFGLSFPSFLNLNGYGILAWFSLVPLLLVLLTVKTGKGIFYGVFFGALQALIINFWHGTFDYVTLHLVIIAFVVEYLVFMTVLVLLIRVSGKWGFLVVPAAWTVFDYIRSIGILGYPWGLIGTSQYPFLPLIQMASISGVWGIGFVVLLCNASLAWALAAPSFGWNWIGEDSNPIRRRMPLRLLPMAVFTAFFAACLVG
ncbi:MAG TPA: hypothetical protein VMX75_00050, partial [Spirochaetia bacterium]|nr:hypothetical protein [Spirochaetia bacterium]